MKSSKKQFEEYEHNGGTMTFEEFKMDGRIDKGELPEDEKIYYDVDDFLHSKGLRVLSVSEGNEPNKYFVMATLFKDKISWHVPTFEMEILFIDFEACEIQLLIDYKKMKRRMNGGYEKKEDQPKTPCCNAPFMAVKDYSTSEGQLGLYTHTICKKCNKKYGLDLKEVKSV